MCDIDWGNSQKEVLSISFHFNKVRVVLLQKKLETFKREEAATSEIRAGVATLETYFCPLTWLQICRSFETWSIIVENSKIEFQK